MVMAVCYSGLGFRSRVYCSGLGFRSRDGYGYGGVLQVAFE